MSKLITEEALTGALTIIKGITDTNKSLAESAQTAANSAATAAQTAQSTADSAKTAANSAATAAQTAQSTANSAQTAANSAATAAQTAQSTADSAQTAANSAATAAQTAQSTADAKQSQLYLHDIVATDTDSGGVLYIKVILSSSTQITQQTQITQTVLDKALSVGYNLDGTNEWLIKADSITKSTSDVIIVGTFISSSGIASNNGSVDLDTCTITDTVVAL